MQRFDSFYSMKWGVLWREMRVFSIGIKADGFAACLAQGNGLYEVGLCLAAIVGKRSVVVLFILFRGRFALNGYITKMPSHLVFTICKGTTLNNTYVIIR